MSAAENTPSRETLQYLRSVLAADPICHGATIINIDILRRGLVADLDDGTTIRLIVERYNTPG